MSLIPRSKHRDQTSVPAEPPLPGPRTVGQPCWRGLCATPRWAGTASQQSVGGRDAEHLRLSVTNSTGASPAARVPLPTRGLRLGMRRHGCWEHTDDTFI